MKCYICGVDNEISFTCNYCKETFCPDHRLPMNHTCRFLNQYIEKRKQMNYNEQRGYNYSNFLRKMLNFRSSRTELYHLGIATILVLLVGLSLTGYRHISYEFILIFISAFLIHELAHKLLAQLYGSWAEFRAEISGLLITAISAIPFFPFKFIAPGAVVIGDLTRNKFGRVALIGPLTNLIMGFSFLILSYLFPYYPYFGVGASFNAWISIFNLIPFGVLDGQKIFNWNKIVWICTIISASILFIISYG
ncbi:MAG: AN1-type zinc finger domain-containing protein [Nitrososphaeraceae archaeon]